jgi:ketol-acid reductoisomerase
VARQIVAPAVQQRTFAAAARSLVRAAAGASAARPAVSVAVQQVRGVKTIDFAGSKEDVYGGCCRFGGGGRRGGIRNR